MSVYLTPRYLSSQSSLASQPARFGAYQSGLTELQQAALGQETEQLKTQLAQLEPSNFSQIKDKHGRTLLMLAAQASEANTQAVLDWLKTTNNPQYVQQCVNMADLNGRTALMYGVSSKPAYILGNRLEIQTNLNETIAIVKMLAKAGANLQATAQRRIDYSGQTETITALLLAQERANIHFAYFRLVDLLTPTKKS